MEQDDFDHLLNPTSLTCMSHYGSTFDQEKYAQIGGYKAIQPEFMDNVLRGPIEAPLEVLEICAGQGQVLEAILSQRNSSPEPRPLRYTVVEKNPANAKKIDAIYKKDDSQGLWVGCARKDLVEFLESNLEQKRGKYEHVFGGFALHIFGAKAFVAVIKGLFEVMKEGGYLYLTQHSYAGKGYDSEYIENVRSGKLLPFWVKGAFWSDPVTMTNLLKAFGFQVIKSGLYRDIHLSNSTETKYLGLMAQKRQNLYDSEKVRQYDAAADLFYVELDCATDVSANKARLLRGARETDQIWSIRDSKVSQDYDALKVYTRNTGAKELLIQRYEVHEGNNWTKRAINTFLIQIVQSPENYQTVCALAVENDTFCKIIKTDYSFKKDETYKHDGGLPKLIRLKAVTSGIKSNLSTLG
jgi:phospholipid N-methyltransferase